MEIRDDQWVASSCFMCYNHCGILVHRINGVVVSIEGNPENPRNEGRLCAKGKAGLMSLYNPNRVKVPLKRTNPEKGIGVDPRWKEMSWEEALDIIVKKLKKVREDDPRKLLMVDFDIARAVEVLTFLNAFGSQNWGFRGADYFCGNALHPMMYLTHGSFYQEPDLLYCAYCLMIGSQMGFLTHTNATRMAKEMADARERGMKVVVVDPVCVHAAAKANEWIPIRPGTDAAFALALTNVLLNELGIYDGEFIKKYTNGPYLIGPNMFYLRDKKTNKPMIWDSEEDRAKPYDEPHVEEFSILGTYVVDGVQCSPSFQILKDHVKKYTSEMASEITTVPAETIRRIAKELGEAARIGSKIVIEGKELPYRPVAVEYSRGPIAHKHGLLTSMACQLLNIVLGAIGVPGGQLGQNPLGPFWSPEEGADGLLTPAQPITVTYSPYPLREIKPPESPSLMDIGPLAPYGGPMYELGIMEPERFKIPYKPEIIIHNRTNLMMSNGDPKVIEKILKQIPFMISFAYEINETTEFADVVLPDTHYLERFEPYTNLVCCFNDVSMDWWVWQIRQPVVEPPAQAKNWIEVLMDIAERVGFLRDYNIMLNINLGLNEPYRLAPDKKYNLEEITELWTKSYFGPEYGLKDAKEKGFLKFKRKLEEKYPRPFIKPRVPIYFEFFKRAGEEVKKVMEELGTTWDCSDYQALPDWKPCPSYGEKSTDYDLVAVNYKLPFHTWSMTQENPWLDDLSEHHPNAYKIRINSETAKRKGIKDGDMVWVESKAGKVRGKVKLTEGIHPEVVGIAGTSGHWAEGLPVARGKGVHFNSLLPSNLERIDILSHALDGCVRVKVYK